MKKPGEILRDQDKIDYRVINCRNQPVEIHLKSKVVVIQPHGESIINGLELKEPHPEYFFAKRYIKKQALQNIPDKSDESKKKTRARARGGKRLKKTRKSAKMVSKTNRLKT